MSDSYSRPKRIALFTDFGPEGLYVGQMHAILSDAGVPVFDLLNNAPVFNPRASSYLVAALARYQPAGTLFLCVVDPGVGSERRPLVMHAGGNWFIGPDNGLFSQLTDYPDVRVGRIDWQPEKLSSSFHGRDLFAPVASRLCKGEDFSTQSIGIGDLVGSDWPEDLPEVVYIDHYGNVMTGISQARLSPDQQLVVQGKSISYARTFSEADVGEAFWYYNSIGLVEVSVNQGHAADSLGLHIGSHIEITGRPAR